ncbi:MAG: hypothetical protein ACLPNY_12965 [Roseiarcus sp.]
MKILAVVAAVLGAGLLATTAQAAMMAAPAPSAAPGIERVGIVCGPGMHLARGVCVRNVVRRCAIGMRLGPAGLCIR